jgi:hypothetical protein
MNLPLIKNILTIKIMEINYRFIVCPTSNIEQLKNGVLNNYSLS